VEVSLGGAARVALGGLDPAAVASPEIARAVGEMQAAGIVPVGGARVGLSDEVDLGLVVAGPLLRADLRWRVDLGCGDVCVSAWTGLGAVGGMIATEAGSSGGRLGAELPVLLGVDAQSLVQLWIGARLAVEHAWGRVAGLAGTGALPGQMGGLRAAGVLGVGLGFRDLHVLFELTAGYERWEGAVGASAFVFEGPALTPAFALRYRL